MIEENAIAQILADLGSAKSWERTDAAVALCRMNDRRGWEYFRSADYISLDRSRMAALASIGTATSRVLLTEFFTLPRYAEMDRGAGPTGTRPRRRGRTSDGPSPRAAPGG